MSYYLLDHRNPHAAGGFHGYRSRSKPVRLVVIHTSQNAFDVDGPDTGAENVAGYLSRTDRQASYHDIVDSDSHVKLLPWDFTAFGARGHNSHAIHIAFAGDAYRWDRLTERQTRLRLERCASLVAAACAGHGLPVRRLVGSRARADDAAGICGHTDLDPDRRSDPGAHFPWVRFLDMVEAHGSPTSQSKESEMAVPTWAQAAWDKINARGANLTAPNDVVTDARLAVILDRIGLLDAASTGGGLSADDVKRIVAATKLVP